MRGISPDALDLLVRHDWPGNVRELENTMERLVVLSPGPYLEPADLIFAGTIMTSATEAVVGTSLKDLERDHIIQTLQRCDGHRRANRPRPGHRPQNPTGKVKTVRSGMRAGATPRSQVALGNAYWSKLRFDTLSSLCAVDINVGCAPRTRRLRTR